MSPTTRLCKPLLPAGPFSFAYTHHTHMAVAAIAVITLPRGPGALLEFLAATNPFLMTYFLVMLGIRLGKARTSISAEEAENNSLQETNHSDRAALSSWAQAPTRQHAPTSPLTRYQGRRQRRHLAP